METLTEWEKTHGERGNLSRRIIDIYKTLFDSTVINKEKLSLVLVIMKVILLLLDLFKLISFAVTK